MQNTLREVTICFLGDSGDGMQLIGEQFSQSAITIGCDITTLPDYPAEIRAPQGTISGVSGFNLTFSNEHELNEVGLKADVIVAMNPAALLKAKSYTKSETLFILNEDTFSAKDYKKAGLSPGDKILKEDYSKLSLPITKQTQNALADFGLSNTQTKKSKNFYVLGLLVWIFDFPKDAAQNFIAQKFKGTPLAAANKQAFEAGFNFAEVSEISRLAFTVSAIEKSQNRQDKNTSLITGIKAVSLALATQASRTQTTVFLSGYPITPASPILQEALKLKDYGVLGFQAEDELSAINAALGAAFSGSIALTVSSGPGMSLKSEALGLAVMTELPLVVINVQRSGPSTGLPTKTEQSDLMQAVFGRHGEAPLVVFAPMSAEDCFYGLLDAMRLAITYMTPVVFLMDAYIANNANRWQVPDITHLNVKKPEFNRFEAPFARDENLARNWPIPGNKTGIHQLGGLEKQGVMGEVSYCADNHQEMVCLRQEKIDSAVTDNPYYFYGEARGSLLLVSWGSTFGALKNVFEQLREKGASVGLLHCRLLNPLPNALKQYLSAYKTVIACELNQGQLAQLLRAKFLVDVQSMTQTNGQAFNSETILQKLEEHLNAVDA